MIHRDKNFNDPPPDLIDPKWDFLKECLLEERHGHNVKSKCYRDTTIDPLVEIYKNKCAICERDRGTELQVDHYRPKKPRSRGDLRYRQPGYFWLAYTWSNLIPLCSKCNQKKGNKFPLKDWSNAKRVVTCLDADGASNNKAYNPVWLHNQEEPLLINPEIDEKPGLHFKYDLKGNILARTSEGEETIKTCALNRRDLKRERKTILNTYVSGIKKAIDEYYSSDDPDKKAELRGALKVTFGKIYNGSSPDRPFSHFHANIFNYFDIFISSQFRDEFRNKIKENFEDYCRRYIWRQD